MWQQLASQRIHECVFIKHLSCDILFSFTRCLTIQSCHDLEASEKGGSRPTSSPSHGQSCPLVLEGGTSCFIGGESVASLLLLLIVNLKTVASGWTREVGGIKLYFKNSPKGPTGSEYAPFSSLPCSHQECRLKTGADTRARAWVRRVCPGRPPTEEADGQCVQGDTRPHSGQRPSACRASRGWRQASDWGSPL